MDVRAVGWEASDGGARSRVRSSFDDATASSVGSIVTIEGDILMTFEYQNTNEMSSN